MPYKVLAHCDAGGVAKGGPSWVLANSTSSTTTVVDKTSLFQMRRNANAVAARMQHQCGVAPTFHHALDPNTDPTNLVVVFEDLVQGEIAAGACEVVHGYIEHINTVNVADLVGIGFRAGTDNKWHCFVNDCPTGIAPVTSRHDFDTSILMTSLHRLTLVINGITKTVNWYIDRVLVSSFTPGALLDRMGSAANTLGPLVLTGAVVPALGDVTIRCRGSGLPQLRVAPFPINPVSSGGQTITAYLG